MEPETRHPLFTENGGQEWDDKSQATLWAMAAASIPWLVYDALIVIPGDFWTWRGAIVIIAVALGVVIMGMAWYRIRMINREEGKRDGLFTRPDPQGRKQWRGRPRDPASG